MTHEVAEAPLAVIDELGLIIGAAFKKNASRGHCHIGEV